MLVTVDGKCKHSTHDHALTSTYNVTGSRKEPVFLLVLACPALTLCVNIFSFASSCTVGFHGEKLDRRDDRVGGK